MVLEFDWDQWNIQKNELKHGVSKLDAESLFYDVNFIVFYDIRHSTPKETRYVSYATSHAQHVLMCAFTIRSNKIRIISVRTASKKERTFYEKEKRKYSAKNADRKKTRDSRIRQIRHGRIYRSEEENESYRFGFYATR